MTKNVPKLDLCEPHDKEAHRTFKPRHKHRGPDKQKRQRKPFTTADKHVPTVMKLATDMEKFTGGDVVRATKLSTWNARELVKKMIKAGKLKTHGKGRGKFITKG